MALYALALYLLLRIGRLVAGREAMFPLTVIGAATLYYIGIFAPGTIDHHNVQLVLMLAMVLFLLQARRPEVYRLPPGAPAPGFPAPRAKLERLDAMIGETQALLDKL